MLWTHDEPEELPFDSIDDIEMSVAARGCYESQLAFLISSVSEDFIMIDVMDEEVEEDDDGELRVYLPMLISGRTKIRLEVCRIGMIHWRWTGEAIH